MQVTSTPVPHRVAVRLVELAARAPSAHNAQPWAWRLLPRQLELHLDTARVRDDPSDERNQVISCGAALHHLQVAAAVLGWEASVTLLPEPGHPTLLACVGLVRRPPGEAAGDQLDALLQRCTDRRRFTSWPVGDARLAELCAAAVPWGVTALPVLDAVERFRLERLVHRSAEVATHSPVDQVVELHASDGVIVLGDVNDDRPAWLRTGQGLSALWLEATRAGLSVVPLSRPVEVDETRAALRAEVLGGWLRPHLLLRIGWQAIGRTGAPRTSRRPVEDLLLGST